MNTFLMWLGGLLISVLAALFAVPHFIDWNGYRGVFEEEASRVFGRDVRVGGSVNVRLLPTPYVSFKKLRIADTSGVTGAPLFEADSFTMWLSVSPLLKGEFEARQVELQKPVIRLAVDRSGAPNWTELAVRQGRLPFTPADVSLNAVKITDGEIAYDAAGVGTLARVTAIDGSLSAQGLRGPFSFRGVAQFDKRLREVRLATGEVSDDGATKIKAVVQRPDAGSRHVLEGDATGLFDRPNFTGGVTSNMKLASGTEVPEIDMRADVEATSASAKLINLIASFENVGQPQIITGEAGATWGERHRVQVNLSSRWLDLDRLSVPFGADPPEDGAALKRPMPLKVARDLFARLIEVLPETADLQAELGIDQVNLGGDAVSNIKMVLSDTGGSLQMRSLTASLPGGTRFDFSGALKPGADGAAFDGNVFVGGPSLVRVVRWAVPDYGRLEKVNDGPFSLSGRMMLGTDVVSLEDGTANFSGMPVSGRVRWQEEPSAKLSLQLEGYELDTRWVGLDQLRLADLMAPNERSPTGDAAASKPVRSETPDPATAPVAAGGAEATATPGSAQPQSPPDEAIGKQQFVQNGFGDDLDITLRAGRLINGPSTLKDFDAKITVKGGVLGVEKLAFQTTEGLKLKSNATISAAEGVPKGDVTFTMSSGDQGEAGPQSLSRLLAEQGLISSSAQTGLDDALAGLVPYRLAGTLSLGTRKSGSVDGQIDGVLQGRHAAGQFTFDGGIEGWREAPALLHLNLESENTLKTLRIVMDKLGAVGPIDGGTTTQRLSRANSAKGKAGSVVVQIEGTPNERLSWVGDVRGDRLDLAWSGSGRYTNAGVKLAKGEIDVLKASSSDLLALVGLSVGQSAETADVSGRLALTGTETSVKISSNDFKLGRLPLVGHVELSDAIPDGVDGSQGQGRANLRVGGDLSVKSMDFSDLLHGVLGQAPVVAPAPRVAVAPSVSGLATDATPFATPGTAAIYSDKAFDLALLNSVVGTVNLNADRFAFEDGLATSDTRISFSFNGEGSVTTDIAAAKSSAGSVAAKLTLSQLERGAGANLDGKLKLSNGRFDRVLGKGSQGPVGTGKADLDATFKGRGLTPRALMLALNGTGNLRLKGVVLNGVAPGKLADAAEDLLSRPPDETIEGEVSPAVVAALGEGQLKLGSTKVPFRIRDGAVRFAEVAIKADGGRVRGTTTLDLSSLSADSAWSIVAASRFPNKPDWPVVEMVFVGPLKALAKVEPQISSGAFERELGVQRLERNALRLEQLRAEDEARAEEARVRAVELERLRKEQEARAREQAARRAREEAIRRRAIEAQETWAPPSVGGASQW
ncbi:MAG: AsmA family protein [Pseudomonadota bacterium]